MLKRLSSLLLLLLLAHPLFADNTQEEGGNSLTSSSQVIGVFGGTCSSTTFLRGDGNCGVVSTVPIAATTAETTAGITIVNSQYQPYDVRRYGVDMTGTTDAATILNALGSATWGSAGTQIELYFPSGTIKIGSTVTFSTGQVSFYFAGGDCLSYSGTATQPAFVLGSSTAGTNRVHFGGTGLCLINGTSHGYTNFGFIGLQLQQVSFSDIHLRELQGFTIDMQLLGSSGNGIAHNRFYLESVWNCIVGIDITSSTVSGFVNENTFFGGDFSDHGGPAATQNTYGVRFNYAAGFYNGHNRNIFYKPSFELQNGNVGTLQEPVLFNDAGGYNAFHDVRVEGGRGSIFDISSVNFAVTANVIDGAIFAGTFTSDITENDQGLAYSNAVSVTADSNISAYHSGDLVKKAWNTGSGLIGVKDAFLQASGSSTEVYSGAGRIYQTAIRLGNGQAIGVYVDTKFYKSFTLRTDADAGFGGRVYVVCYDINGNILNNSSGLDPYVVFPFAAGQAVYGYAYHTSADSNNPITFSVGSTVAKIKVLMSGGTNALKLRSFDIFPNNHGLGATQALYVTSGLSQDNNQWFSSGNPATLLGGGFVSQGQFINNSAAASSGTLGWVATASGYLASPWTGTATVEVGQMMNNDTGKVYVDTIAGITNSTGGPTGTGSAITDGTATWNYIGTLATFAVQVNQPTAIGSPILIQGGPPFVMGPSGFFANNGVWIDGQTPGSSATVSFGATSGSTTMTFSAGTPLTGTSAGDVGRVLTILDTTYKYATITAFSSSTVATVTISGGTLSGTGPFANNAIWISGTQATTNTAGADTVLHSAPFASVYANGYGYLPANSLSAAFTAGYYFMQCQSTTVCTYFNNLAPTTGQPTIPASPTAFSTTGPGAFTQTTAINNINAIQAVVAAGAMGLNGELQGEGLMRTNTSANNKQLFFQFNGALLWGTLNNTAALNPQNLMARIRNMGVANVQQFNYTANTPTSSGLAASFGAVDTSASENIELRLESSAAPTDWEALEGYSIKIYPN